MFLLACYLILGCTLFFKLIGPALVAVTLFGSLGSLATLHLGSFAGMGLLGIIGAVIVFLGSVVLSILLVIFSGTRMYRASHSHDRAAATFAMIALICSIIGLFVAGRWLGTLSAVMIVLCDRSLQTSSGVGTGGGYL